MARQPGPLVTPFTSSGCSGRLRWHSDRAGVGSCAAPYVSCFLGPGLADDSSVDWMLVRPGTPTWVVRCSW